MSAAQLSVVVATVAFAGLAVLGAWLEITGWITGPLLVTSILGFVLILGMLATDAKADRSP
jgi:Flp pilus assembly protein protease CpaA